MGEVFSIFKTFREWQRDYRIKNDTTLYIDRLEELLRLAEAENSALKNKVQELETSKKVKEDISFNSIELNILKDIYEKNGIPEKVMTNGMDILQRRSLLNLLKNEYILCIEDVFPTVNEGIIKRLFINENRENDIINSFISNDINVRFDSYK